MRGFPLYFDKTRLNPCSILWGSEEHGFFPVTIAYPLYNLGAYEIQVNLGYPTGPLYKENKSGIYEPEVMQSQADTVFDGIWGNEGYYHDPALIRKELTRPVGEPDDDTKRVVEDIDRTKNSCFVSVRRGEYRYLGCCLPLEYYLAGMKRVASGHPGTKFFIFTDDREWCREHFHKPGCTVVGHSRLNGADGLGTTHWDLWLMSMTKHAVLSNSSFAWWGAWLNPDKETIVVPSGGVYPSRWTVIPSGI